MYKVCILMSTYNGEDYIRTQIDSILAQDISDMHLLVRDDGSKDSTLEILEEYKAKGQLEYYQNEIPNYTDLMDKIGKSFFDLCKNAPAAEYYAFADQDDYWLPNKLSVAIDMLEKESERLGYPYKHKIVPDGDEDSDEESTIVEHMPLLYCSYARLVDKDLNHIKHKRPKRRAKALRYYRSLMRTITPGCTNVINREALLMFLKYDYDYLGIHDWILQKVVALTGKIVYDKNSYILYRQHGKNACGTTKTKLTVRFREVWNEFYRAISTSASGILHSYGDILTPAQYKHVDLLANYRTSFWKKTRLFFSFKLTGNSFLYKVGTKLMVLFNRL